VRRTVTAVVVAGLASASASASAACIGGSSRKLLPVTSTPAAYRIVYRVESGKDRTTRIVEARRPFELRTETRAGTPPGGGVLSTSIASFARLSTRSADSPPTVIAIPPAPSPGDLRPESGLKQAVQAGVLKLGPRRRVLGTLCQTYKSPDKVESCIDARGLLLEQRSAGQRVVAVTVDDHPSLPDGDFDTSGPPLTIQQGGGSVRPVDATTLPPGTWWVLPEPPAGFTYRGRFAVVPPNQSEGFADPGKRDALVAGFVDVYQRGTDVLVVDQGSTLGGTPPFEPDPTAEPFDLGPVGKGELVLTVGSALARINLGQGHYLRLVGTLPPADLRAVAANLTKVSGSALRYLD
jgi:hypothetical protein